MKETSYIVRDVLSEDMPNNIANTWAQLHIDATQNLSMHFQQEWES